MTKLRLYHGTDCEIEKIELSRSLPKRDFGVGFYMTTIKAQAESWAIGKRRINASEHAVMYVYEAELSDELRIKIFGEMTEEWLDMIKRNRLMGGVRHPYDIVIGPEADDGTWKFLDAYIREKAAAKETLRKLKTSGERIQVSFHTERALRCLCPVKKYYID